MIKQEELEEQIKHDESKPSYFVLTSFIILFTAVIYNGIQHERTARKQQTGVTVFDEDAEAMELEYKDAWKDSVK